jgi:cytochrome c oxidase subunit IV
MEGVMDPIAAIHNGKQQRIRYQNLLEYVRESGGSISAQQLADHQRALKLRRRYVIFFFIAMLFVLSTLSFLPEGFKPFAGILLAAPLTSLIAALLITDRNVVIVRRGKHMSFIKYIFGGFCERTPIKAG